MIFCLLITYSTKIIKLQFRLLLIKQNKEKHKMRTCHWQPWFFNTLQWIDSQAFWLHCCNYSCQATNQTLTHWTFSESIFAVLTSATIWISLSIVQLNIQVAKTKRSDKIATRQQFSLLSFQAIWFSIILLANLFNAFRESDCHNILYFKWTVNEGRNSNAPIHICLLHEKETLRKLFITTPQLQK